MASGNGQGRPWVDRTCRLVLVECEPDSEGVEQAVLSALGDPSVTRAFPVVVRPYTDGMLEDAHVVVVAQREEGVSLCGRGERIAAAGFPGPLVAVCDRMDEDLAVRGYSVGFHAWLTLPLRARVFAAQIEALAARMIGNVGPPQVDVSLRRDRRQLTIDGTSVRLTGREFDVFCYLLARREIWTDSARIIAEVFPGKHAPSSAVLRVQIHAIRHALGPALAWVLEGAEGKGYRVTLRRDSTAALRGSPHPRYRR